MALFARTIARSALALAGTLTVAAPAFAENHAERQWLVRDSAHFSLHYYAGIEQTAERLLRAAEEAYPKLSADFGVKVDTKIPIIITQDSFFNGQAEPLKDRITLDPVLANSSVIGTQRFVAHELAHVLTFKAMDKGNKMAQLNSLGGLPTWFLEGIAQYESEYWYPSNDRMLRLHTLENTLLTTTERTNFRMLGLHAGAAGYNEGYSLCRYMFDTYGRDKVSVLMANLKDGKRSFEQAIEATFGQNLAAVEAGWKQSLRDGYKKQVAGLQEQVPGSTKLVSTYQGEVNIQPRISPNGSRMAYLTSRYQDNFLYLRGNVMGFLSLYVSDPDGRNAQQLQIGKGAVNNFAWASDSQRLVYSRVVGDKNGNPSFDLFVYDLKARTSVRLTENEGANHMAWRPNSSQVAFVSVKDGYNVVKLIDTKTKKVTIVHKATGDDQFKDIAWSPDGYRMALITHKPGLAGHLVTLDPTSGKLTTVTPFKDRVSDSHPSFTPDGKHLVFTSDRSGMTNLYQTDLAGKSTRQLTNTYRGAETASLTPDGKAILFTSYRSKGSEIYRMPMVGGTPAAPVKTGSPGSSRPLSISLNQPLITADAETTSLASSGSGLNANLAMAKPGPSAFEAGGLTEAIGESLKIQDAKPYRPTMTNDLIIPQMTSDEKGQQVGVAAIYSDILDKQQLGVDVRFGIMSQRFSYMFQYANNMWDTSWNVSLYDQPSIALAPDVGLTGRAVTDSLYFQRQRGASLGTQTPLGGGRTFLSAVNMGTLTTLSDPRAGNYGQLREGQLNTVRMGLREQNMRSTVDMDINPSDGYVLGLDWTLSDGKLGSSYNYSQYQFQGERYFAINPEWRHNLTWRWNLGLINGEAPQPYLLGGANGSNPIVALRGYTVGAFSGSRVATTGLEYVAPIFTHIDRMFGPLYMDRLYISAFTDVGSAWNANDRSNPFASVGAELRLRTSVMGRQLLTFRLGLAQKLGSTDMPGFYITF